jgi:hypothetical protein
MCEGPAVTPPLQIKRHKNRECITSGGWLAASLFNTGAEMLMMSGGIETTAAVNSGMMS